MPKKAGIVFVTVGAVLIISALLLFSQNRSEDSQAGEQSQVILEDVQVAIKEQPQEAQTEETTPKEMTVVEIDGYGYIGYLSIPALELELPVMSEWDYDRLKIAPCRQFGSTYTEDLVIAAHNYITHFAYLYKLSGGEALYFTDMDGNVTAYTVDKVEKLSPTAVEEVQNSGYPLTLYTCTYGNNARTVVFCQEAMP